MNEVKLSTRVTEKMSRLAIKLNLKELGVGWSKNDVIRIISHKEDGTLILKRVGTKAKKTVAHTLTSTGSGTFSHDVGLYMSYKPRRFRNKFKEASSVTAGVRFIDEAKTLLQVFLPRDIFVNESCIAVK